MLIIGQEVEEDEDEEGEINVNFEAQVWIIPLMTLTSLCPKERLLCCCDDSIDLKKKRL